MQKRTKPLIRPFGIRDILLIRQLQGKGITLDMEGAILRPRTPLRDALMSQIPLNGCGAVTYVLRDQGQRGFIQARQGRHPTESYLTFVAPALSEDEAREMTWCSLLEELCRGEGERGVQRVYAKLPESAEVEAELFRRTGFRVYTQEHVFYLPRAVTVQARGVSSISLRPYRSTDAWGVHRLYCLGSPRFVQQAEHVPGEIGEAATSDWAQGRREERHVWVRDGEVVGYIRLLIGELGHWLHLLIHPNQMDHATALLHLGIARLKRDAPRPIYCTVRSYEVALQHALTAAGFKPHHTRSLMVRQIAVPVREPASEPALAIEGAEMKPTVSSRLSSPNGREKPAPVPAELCFAPMGSPDPTTQSSDLTIRRERRCPARQKLSGNLS